MAMNIFHLAKDDVRLEVGDGVSKPFRATIQAVVKTNEIVETCIANEYIASGIGRFLGLPLAPGAVVGISPASNTFGYASLQFNLTNETLPEIEPKEVVQKMSRLATGVVVFDILIANPDRHTGNLSALVYSKRPRLLVFDHSHALLGYDGAASISRLSALKGRLGISGGEITGQNRHCLLDALDDASWFHGWLDRVQSLPNHVVEDLCADMLEMNFVNDLESTVLREFLIHRRDKMPELIHAHKNEFKGINQWGLDI